MIAFLHGTVEHILLPYIFLSVNGVGYKVLVSMQFAATLKLHDTIKIFTYTYVREDALDLYGFGSIEDLKLFELLISVSGIGPKTAIGIFSQAGSNEIVKAIHDGNVQFFSSVPRLGKKNAQKIIIELRSKIGNKETLDLTSSDSSSDALTQALQSFGFSAAEIHKAIQEIKDENMGVEEKLKMALKYLGR